MVNSITIVGKVIEDPIQKGNAVTLKVTDPENKIDFFCITKKFTKNTMQNAKVGRSITVIGRLKSDHKRLDVSEIKTEKDKEN